MYITFVIAAVADGGTETCHSALDSRGPSGWQLKQIENLVAGVSNK
jgi:hypothetical protein